MADQNFWCHVHKCRQSLEKLKVVLSNILAGPASRDNSGVDASRKIAPAKHHLVMIAHYGGYCARSQALNAFPGIRPVADDVTRTDYRRARSSPVDVREHGIESFDISMNIRNQCEFHDLCKAVRSGS
jgi:hypothetical protein